MNLQSLAAYQPDFHEYLSRADFFIRHGNTSSVPEWVRSISIVSAIYALQAAFEVASTAVSLSPTDAEKAKRLRKEFLNLASAKVRHLYLLDALRNHDFHCQAIVFQEGSMKGYGPMPMRVSQAGEAVTITPDKTGRMTVYRTKDGKESAQPYQRNDTLQTHGFHVLEPESGRWVHILQILTEHMQNLAALLIRRPATPPSAPPDGGNEPTDERTS